MTWGAIAGAAISTAGSIYSSSKQAGASKKAMKKMDPFGKYRGFYGEELKQLWEDPSSIYEDPAFVNALTLGQQGVKRQMAASGFLDSGNMATGLMQYGMGFGLDWMKDTRQFLALLAGAGIAPNQGPGLAGYGQAMGGIGGAAGMLGGFFGGGGFDSLFGGGYQTLGTWNPGNASLPGGGSINPSMPVITGR